ncbi:hypothetical protein [Borreliella burgdorferi]|nr:hypothetical protein [Borreliella burgdorferi]MCD2386248.1 hypothetical protein [Borreliella burgdorferi]MCD2387501.1 hypothetical protein [Borreliella burgdorferi]MCD2390435.1 hypothetical protein [Borreliella burgdorferi]
MQNIGKVAFDVSKDLIRTSGKMFDHIGDLVSGLITALIQGRDPICVLG